MKLSIKIAKNMYSNFDYIKIDPQFFFFPKYVRFFSSRLLEIKKLLKD